MESRCCLCAHFQFYRFFAIITATKESRQLVLARDLFLNSLNWQGSTAKKHSYNHLQQLQYFMESPYSIQDRRIIVLLSFTLTVSINIIFFLLFPIFIFLKKKGVARNTDFSMLVIIMVHIQVTCHLSHLVKVTTPLAPSVTASETRN